MDDEALRPREWDGYIGQPALKRRLQVHIASAQAHSTPFPHTLFVAPPGMGKTSLAELVALQMCDPFEVLDQPLSATELNNLIYRFGEGILILDEIHRYPRRTQEDLLPLIGEGYIRVAGGTEKFYLDYFTIIACTTEPQDLIRPLYERFEASCLPPFAPYTDEELSQIVMGMAAKGGIDMDDETAMALGKAAAGIPRIARQFILAARDLGGSPTAEEILEFCQVAPDGLTQNHLSYLRTLEQLGGLKGVGLRQVCAMMRLNEGVVRGLERLLFDRGLVVPTPTGRALTPAGMARVTTRRTRARVA